MTWEETEILLEAVRGCMYRFLEIHTKDEIKANKELRAELQAIRDEAIRVHNLRIDCNMRRLK